MSDPNHPGVHVYALRRLHRLTQEALAERSGLRRTEIVDIENGRNLCTSARVTAALALGFGITTDQASAVIEGVLEPSAAYKMRKS